MIENSKTDRSLYFTWADLPSEMQNLVKRMQASINNMSDGSSDIEAFAKNMYWAGYQDGTDNAKAGFGG